MEVAGFRGADTSSISAASRIRHASRKLVANPSAATTLIYDEIKKRIITVRYAPGTKLSEVQLVQELGYGRSPIRTAFARLHNDGWVSVSPQSGTYVKQLSEAEIQEIFDVRLLLEVHATRLAAHHMTPAHLRELRTAFRRFAPLGVDGFDQDMFEDMSELDAFFHATVYRAAGNSLITNILLSLLEKIQWLKNAAPSTPKRMSQWFGELKGVLDALEKRDPDLAVERMREHIDHAADSGSEYRRRHPRQRQKGPLAAPAARVRNHGR